MVFVLFNPPGAIYITLQSSTFRESPRHVSKILQMGKISHIIYHFIQKEL